MSSAVKGFGCEREILIKDQAPGLAPQDGAVRRRGWEEMEEKHILPLSSGNFWCPTGSSHWPTTTGSQSTRESEEAVHKGETPRKINNMEDRQWVDMGSK